MTNSEPAVTGRHVAAAIAICLTMMTAMLWLPAVLGAIAQGYNYTPAQISPFASLQLAGFVVGTLIASTLTLSKFRLWLLAGCAIVAAANLALVVLAASPPFALILPLAGLGAGIGFGYALKICALSPNPTKGFGILTGLLSLAMIFGFQGVAMVSSQAVAGGAAPDAAARGAASTVFVTYAVFAGLAAIIFLTNKPPRGTEAAHVAAAPKAQSALGPMALLGLAAIIVTFIGQGSVWAFLQTLGAAHGFSGGDVANAMSVFAIAGVAGSFAVTALPKSLPAWTAIGGALVLLFGGLVALYAPQSIAWYIGGCAIAGFYWNFTLPQILALLARIDPSGRASVLGGSMSSVGCAVGPMAAAPLISGTNYQPVGWLVAGACLVGVLAVFIVESRSKTPIAQPA